jgi:hypothetical protein
LLARGRHLSSIVQQPSARGCDRQRPRDELRDPLEQAPQRREERPGWTRPQPFDRHDPPPDRDIEAAQGEGLPWIVENSFVTDANALKAQLAALEAAGGGDEPESLLDALYKVASMEATPKGAQSADPGKWRYRSDAARAVVVFTDASFKETMSVPEAKGGSLQDVANIVMANRIILSLFAPNFEGYDRLSQIDKSEWEVVEYEGLSPQEALKKFTSDPVNFRNTLKQLAASVSRSAETVAL